jgi:serine/threonine-protein kinase
MSRQTSSRPDETLLVPRPLGHATTRDRPRELPADILEQSALRLQRLALIYAFTFFMASFLPNLLIPAARARLLEAWTYWIPDALSILTALIVAALTMSQRVPRGSITAIGLVFLVVSSYGIAIAEYVRPGRLENMGWVGLSWVAVWTTLFTVLVPSRPRMALLATLAALSSVPVVIGVLIAVGFTAFRPGAVQFFFAVVFPYLLVAILAYVSQSSVYALGTEVTRARELGSYRLIERLGEGGMGEVWRAKHRFLARPAAIKLLRPKLTGRDEARAADALRRFQREAQVTAQLRSPHTVELWDFGVADDGGFYYVMELLDGLDLDTLVRRYGPLPAERTIYLLRQICHSLAEAEASGLVHRDIKPANVFLCRYGGDYDFIKVLDFGIVKTQTSSSTETGILATREDVLQGTPAFIAPEQALGGSEVDSRADIYATGCVAYWLVTGQLVFTAETSVGVLLHHAHTAPVPPSARTELPVPPALDAVIMSCLAKDPAERPQTARELSRRLDQVSLLEPWNEDRAREWWVAHGPAAA